MALAFGWAAVILLPTALGWAVFGVVRLFRRLAACRSAGAALPEPIERLGANLTRLHAALEEAENQTEVTPFKATRLRALRAAYVDVLSAACQRLEVGPPVPGSSNRVPLTEIYRAEAALRERGLDVRHRASGGLPR